MALCLLCSGQITIWSVRHSYVDRWWGLRQWKDYCYILKYITETISIHVLVYMYYQLYSFLKKLCYTHCIYYTTLSLGKATIMRKLFFFYNLKIAIYNKQITRGLFLDVSNAFETINGLIWMITWSWLTFKTFKLLWSLHSIKYFLMFWFLFKQNWKIPVPLLGVTSRV